MLNKLLVLLAFFSLNACANTQNGMSRKFATIRGQINRENYHKFADEMGATYQIPGDRYIVLESEGGDSVQGKKFIKTIEMEKKMFGTKIVCLVQHEATSMAFDILSHCDKRYATTDSVFLVHKLAYQTVDCKNVRCTAENLQYLVDGCKLDDQYFDDYNIEAMHITKEMYDNSTKYEHVWTYKELRAIGYLNGAVSNIKFKQ